MNDYPAPPPDTKDWTWVVDRRCPDCGFDASTVAAADLPGLIAELTAPWPAVLARPEVRRRPAPTTWSPLEYGCHVGEVCALFTTRTRMMLDSDRPTFPDWDQDVAAVDGRYHAQHPERVAAGIAAHAQVWADTYASVADDRWDREGLRGDGAAFSVLTLGRYGMHDLAHHLVDVGVSPTW